MFELTEDLKRVRETARRFADEVVAPRAARDDEEKRFPRDLVTKMGELGLFGSAFPPEVGGTGLGYLAHALVAEEVTRAHSALRPLFNSNGMTGAMTVFKRGTDAQRSRVVPKLLSGEWVGCFALTEPNVGSDVASIETTAVRRGDHYVLNGAKTWISHATVFDMGVLFARTDPKGGHRGLTAFLVERSTPGLATRDLPKKMGHHASPTGMLLLEDAKIPAEYRLGEEGEGFAIAMEALDRGRLSVAAGAVGVAEAALREAIKYAGARRQFGRPIGEFQMVQDKIATMAVEVEAARLLVWKLGDLFDRGEPATQAAAMAKLFASETAVRVAGMAVEIHGGYGYSEEYPVARLFRDAKMYQVGEGTSHVMKLVIAKRVLGR